MADEPTKSDSPAAPVPVPVRSAPVRVIPAVAPEVDAGYTQSGVPTFESVREKIETRYGTSLGAAELDAETAEGRSIEEQYDERQRAAADRLAQIRESMRAPEDHA